MTDSNWNTKKCVIC